MSVIVNVHTCVWLPRWQCNNEEDEHICNLIARLFNSIAYGGNCGNGLTTCMFCSRFMNTWNSLRIHMHTYHLNTHTHSSHLHRWPSPKGKVPHGNTCMTKTNKWLFEQHVNFTFRCSHLQKSPRPTGYTSVGIWKKNVCICVHTHAHTHIIYKTPKTVKTYQTVKTVKTYRKDPWSCTCKYCNVIQ